MNGRRERGGERPPEGSGGRAFTPVALSHGRPAAGRWLMIAATLLLVAIVKPWGGPGTADEGGRGGELAGRSPNASPNAPTLVTPSPTGRPGAVEAAVSAICLDPGSWRVASIELWRDQTIRVWRAIDPARTATGPDDPTIPVIVVVSEGLPELGWCAPVVEEHPAILSARVDAWRRTASGSVAIRLVGSHPPDGNSPFGALYGPPPSPAIFAAPTDPESVVANGKGSLAPAQASLHSWLDGTYVFRYGSAAGVEAWFAVQVELRSRTGRLP